MRHIAIEWNEIGLCSHVNKLWMIICVCGFTLYIQIAYIHSHSAHIWSRPCHSIVFDAFSLISELIIYKEMNSLPNTHTQRNSFSFENWKYFQSYSCRNRENSNVVMTKFATILAVISFRVFICGFGVWKCEKCC